MTPRERALAVYRFQETDVPCFDLMEGTVWPELAEDFINKYGMSDLEQIQTALGCDFRWTIFRTRFNPGWETEDYSGAATYADDVGTRVLKSAKTPADVRRMLILNPDLVQIPDFAGFRKEHPDMALICCPAWMPSFSGACEDFGMVQAMSLMALEPEIIEEYVRIKKNYALEIIRRAIKAGAAKYCDFMWLGDERTGAMIIAKALEEPVKQIATNAGLEGSVIVDKVKNSDQGIGFNVLNEKFENMVEAGIVDPTKVTRSALENAASIAAMLLTTEAVVSDIPEPTPPAPAPGPGMM
jgi:hypothetical protein